jgi:hypothetical protein
MSAIALASLVFSMAVLTAKAKAMHTCRQDTHSMSQHSIHDSLQSFQRHAWQVEFWST